MILEYTVTKKDYENVICSDLKKRKRVGGCGCLVFVFAAFAAAGLGLTLLLSLTMGNLPDPLTFLPVLLLPALVLLLFVFTSKRVTAKLTLRSRIRSGGIDRQYFGRHTLEVKDDRMVLRYGNVEGERLYGGIDHITEYKDAVAIFLSSVACDIIPNAAFRDAEERHSFISMLQSRMAAARDVPMEGETIEKSRAEAKYTVDYSWDEPSLIDALVAGNRLIYKTKLMWTPGRIIMTIIGLLLLFCGVMLIRGGLWFGADGSDSGLGVFIFLFSGVVLLLNPIVAFTPWIRTIIVNQVRSGAVQRDMVGNHTLCVYANSIKIFNRLSNQDINMEQLYCVRRQGNILYLLFKAKMITPVPVSAFQSENVLTEVVAFIESRIERK